MLIIDIITKLQELLNIQENRIPSDLVWDYGNNEKLDDDKKIKTLSAIQRTMAVPYSTRAKIITPILNKLIDENIDVENMIKEYDKEREDIKLNYEEF